eukprot:m.42901 g.42901  ORF g.42901 m.42901 type:complete len:92 (+) comp10535_c0_seq2:1222-1497(+)
MNFISLPKHTTHSHSSTKAHIARAALEAVCFQTREMLEAMAKDCTFAISTLRVDGGMTMNNLLLQFQADILGIPVCKNYIAFQQSNHHSAR